MSQSEGGFENSARLRLMIDVASGVEPREFSDALGLPEWRDLFGLAEDVAAGKVPPEEAAAIIRSRDFDWATSQLLIHLGRRFVKTDPATALVLVRLIESGLAESPNYQDRGGALLLLSETHYLLDELEEAKRVLGDAVRVYRDAGDDLYLGNALANLSNIFVLQQQHGQVKKVYEQYSSFITGGKLDDHKFRLRCDYIESLYATGDFRECCEQCSSLAQLVDHSEVSPDVPERIVSFASASAQALGLPVPERVLESFAKSVLPSEADVTIHSLRLQAESHKDKGELQQAVEILEKAREIAVDVRDLTALVEVLVELGEVLSRQMARGGAFCTGIRTWTRRAVAA